MPEPTNVVRCPFCQHPYPMTALQREVYRGRTMGCMSCGRPFKVAEVPHPQSAVDPARAGGGDGATDSFEAAAEPVEGGGDARHPAPGRADAPGRSTAASTRTPRANVLAVASVGFGVLFFLLIVAVAITGWAVGSASGGAGGTATADGALRGLTYAAVASAGIALLLGAGGLLQARRSAAGGRGYAVAGMSLGGGGLFISGCLLAVLMPSINRQREQDNREVCVARLQQIGYALNAFASTDPQSRYPDGLDALIVSGAIPADALVCPGSADAPAPGVTRGDQATAITSRPGHLSYVYAARGRTLDATAVADAVLAYESAGHHSDGIHVLFLDGMVAFVNKSQVGQLIAEINAGQNPSPTATAARP